MNPSLEAYAEWVLHPPLPERAARPRSSPAVLRFSGLPRDGRSIAPLTARTSDRWNEDWLGRYRG